MVNLFFKLLLCLQTAFAESALLPAAEYILSQKNREDLISVELFGSVRKPGVYYVPQDTPLTTVLTLAGGLNSDAKSDEVLLHKKIQLSGWLGADYAEKIEDRSYQFSIERLIVRNGIDKVTIQQGDFIYVPQETAWISGETSRTVQVISLTIGAILTALLISERIPQ